MYSFEPKELSVPEVHQFLLSGVAPRPIAFVSTLSTDGIRNLSPFSFFNCFGANPPVVAFSPAVRGRDGMRKDTYHNLIATGECVIHTVTYSMVQQVNLSSCEYDSDVDEFVKSGFTPIPSDIVKPFRVKEAPFQMECKLMQMIELGGKAASGNLAICEVVKFHIAEDVIVENRIHPDLIDLVARNGADFYTRASGDAIFEVMKPGKLIGMGFEALPNYIKESNILTANNLGLLAISEYKPSANDAKNLAENYNVSSGSLEEFERYARISDYNAMFQVALYLSKQNYVNSKSLFERTAQMALAFNDIDFAWITCVYFGEVLDK